MLFRSIGNLTSQLWGNFYLDAMDHAITEQAGYAAYLRYTDDFLIFANDRADLWRCRELVQAELRTVRLTLAEPKSRLLATREGVPFCGMRFLPGLRPRILGATKRRFERRRRQLAAKSEPATWISSLAGWTPFAAEANSRGLILRHARDVWPPNAHPPHRWSAPRSGQETAPADRAP